MSQAAPESPSEEPPDTPPAPPPAAPEARPAPDTPGRYEANARLILRRLLDEKRTAAWQRRKKPK